MKKFLLSTLVAAIAVTSFLAIRPNNKNIVSNTSAATTPTTTGTVAQKGAPKTEVARFYVDPVLK